MLTSGRDIIFTGGSSQIKTNNWGVNLTASRNFDFSNAAATAIDSSNASGNGGPINLTLLNGGTINFAGKTIKTSTSHTDSNGVI